MSHWGDPAARPAELGPRHGSQRSRKEVDPEAAHRLGGMQREKPVCDQDHRSIALPAAERGPLRANRLVAELKYRRDITSTSTQLYDVTV